MNLLQSLIALLLAATVTLGSLAGTASVQTTQGTGATAPVYRCDSITATQLERTRVRFTTSTTAENGAQIAGYVYDFGDGDRVDGGSIIDHEYAQPDTYTVRVFVHIRVGSSKDVKVVTGSSCTLTVTV